MKGQIRVVAGKRGSRAEGSPGSQGLWQQAGVGADTEDHRTAHTTFTRRCESVMQREGALVALGLNL